MARQPWVKSYSQVGEDLQIAYLLHKQRDVRYIDVGCLWPIQHSNSYFFYRRGGLGLCVDANPTVGDTYREERPRDVFVNCGVGARPGTATYAMHANPVYNTIVEGHADPDSVVDEVEIEIRTLTEIVRDSGILERTDGEIDFLSIDVEGAEVGVIEGLDLDLVRPRLIVAEHIRRKSEPVEEAEIVSAMERRGYWLASYTGHDLYFLDGAPR